MITAMSSAPGFGPASRPSQSSTTMPLLMPAASRPEKSIWQIFAARPASALSLSILIPPERIEQVKT